jgi:hypothetical protein
MERDNQVNEKLDQPIFDTLQYAQQLKAAGIEKAEECARALCQMR